MPKWVSIVLTVALLFAIFLAGVFVTLQFTNVSKTQGGDQPVATVNATAVAAITPTWGPGDMATAIHVAKPTPFVKWTVADIEAFNAALAGKKTLLAKDILIGATYSIMNAEWVCRPLKLGDWNLPGSNIGSANAIEGIYSLGTNLSDMSFDVSKGSEYTVAHDDGITAPYIEKRNYAILTIRVAQIGILGPEVTWGNEVILSISEPAIGYKIWLLPRELISGVDLINQKRIEVNNLAADKVKIESLTPGGSDINLKAMYATFEASMGTPGTAENPHIYDTILALFEPVAKEKGFAGIEKVIVVMPPVPVNAYGWLFLHSGMPVLPTDYSTRFSDSTCPAAKPDDATWRLLEENK